MSFYERFEHGVALVLSAVIAVIIVIALWRLISEVFSLLVLGVFDPFDHKTFQLIFGMIMTLLIAMEFKHSIIKVLERDAHIIQVQTVILIAQLALARKFIILDLQIYEAMQIFALGFAVLVLAVAQWLMRERDRAEWLGEKQSLTAVTTPNKREER
uniref:phosphate-starvation-inducible PsiE family protein n=1 Tax=Methylomarinum vadi TaxID=438855 RepID=UPI000B0825A2|nr:phosphate-starvation-inducible PsiE family protein [Methylomarinum vadi]